jgi:hypothetical protein
MSVVYSQMLERALESAATRVRAAAGQLQQTSVLSKSPIEVHHHCKETLRIGTQVHARRDGIQGRAVNTIASGTEVSIFSQSS